jgi:glycosyltransferase involved in cell wall biosynthesis
MRQLKGLHLATDASDDLSPPTPSGTPTVLRGLYRLSQALREHRISIVNAAPDDVSIRAMAALPAFLRGLSPIRAIRALLKQRSYDFFYSTSPEGLLLLSLARAVGVCRRPIVLGDPGLDRQWRTRHLVLKLVLPHIDAVAAITRGQVGIALSDWNARAAFHSGLNIDTAFFDPPLDDVRPDASYAFAPGEDIGRDYDTLFEAMRRADFRTVIKRSRTRIDVPGDLAERVVYIDQRLSYSEFRDLYLKASLVIVCCRETDNASGITVCAEAMCMRRPLIVTDTRVLRGEFPDGTCLTVPVGDPQALAEAVRWIYANPRGVAAMVARAKAFADVHFTAASEAARFAKAIRGLVDGLPPWSRPGYDGGEAAESEARSEARG